MDLSPFTMMEEEVIKCTNRFKNEIDTYYLCQWLE